MKWPIKTILFFIEEEKFPLHRPHRDIVEPYIRKFMYGEQDDSKWVCPAIYITYDVLQNINQRSARNGAGIIYSYWIAKTSATFLISMQYHVSYKQLDVTIHDFDPRIERARRKKEEEMGCC